MCVCVWCRVFRVDVYSMVLYAVSCLCFWVYCFSASIAPVHDGLAHCGGRGFRPYDGDDVGSGVVKVVDVPLSRRSSVRRGASKLPWFVCLVLSRLCCRVCVSDLSSLLKVATSMGGEDVLLKADNESMTKCRQFERCNRTVQTSSTESYRSATNSR